MLHPTSQVRSLFQILGSSERALVKQANRLNSEINQRVHKVDYGQYNKDQ
jgi:hypothetical protein